MVQKDALKDKFKGEAWKPKKRLSPDALEAIRAMHHKYPDKFTTPVLSEQFQVSPEVLRRILKSKWKPSAGEEDRRAKRWDRRGERIWTQMAELGTRPPKKWREMGVGKSPEGGPPKWKTGGKETFKSKGHRQEYTPWAHEEVGSSSPQVGSPSMADRIL